MDTGPEPTGKPKFLNEQFIFSQVERRFRNKLEKKKKDHLVSITDIAVDKKEQHRFTAPI